METITTNASKKRKLLALYLDFILFMVIWGYIEYFIFPNALPFWMGVAAFGIIKTLTFKLYGSPGNYLLSIDREGMVNPSIHASENWLTILLGVIFVLVGTKELVRWTQTSAPEPLFGFLPDSSVQIAFHLSSGVFSILIGYLFLKLRKSALWLALVFVASLLTSAILSWRLWDEVIPGLVSARRAIQGMPVRKGEVEMMQAIMPEGIVLLGVLLLVAILCSYPRLFARDQQSTQQG